MPFFLKARVKLWRFIHQARWFEPKCWEFGPLTDRLQIPTTALRGAFSVAATSNNGVV